MKINSYNQKQILQFCGSNNSKKMQLETKNDTFSLSRIQQEKYKNSYCQSIIPDLFEYISKTGNIKEEDIKGIAGNGGLSIVFDLGDKVLKGSLENPLEYRKHNPAIDIPFLSPVEKFGKTYFVKEAKADTEHISSCDCTDVINRIKKSGLETSRDLDMYKTNQIGKYQGKAYLLDTRCAVPRPNRFSRFVYDFKKFNMRVYKAISFGSAEEIAKLDRLQNKKVELFGPQCLHIDETPRPNLSLKRGLAIMHGVINRNKKAGLPAVDVLAVLECIIRAIFK